MTSIKYCRQCGKMLSPDSNFCPYCGNRIDRESNEDAVERGATFEELKDIDSDIESGAIWEGREISRDDSVRDNYSIHQNSAQNNTSKQWICEKCGMRISQDLLPHKCPSCGTIYFRESGQNASYSDVAYALVKCAYDDGYTREVVLKSDYENGLRGISILSKDFKEVLCSRLRSSKEEVHSYTILCHHSSGRPYLLIVEKDKVLKPRYSIDDSIYYADSIDYFFSHFRKEPEIRNAPNSNRGYYKNGNEVICIDNLKRYAFKISTEYGVPEGVMIAIVAIISIAILILAALIIESNILASIVWIGSSFVLLWLGSLISDNSAYTVIDFKKKL